MASRATCVSRRSATILFEHTVDCGGREAWCRAQVGPEMPDISPARRPQVRRLHTERRTSVAAGGRFFRGRRFLVEEWTAEVEKHGAGCR